MNVNALYLDVKARLEADTGANGLFPTGADPLVSGIFNQHASGELFGPFIVFDVIAAPQGDTFTDDIVNFTFSLTVFASKTPGDWTVAQRILERLYGDGIKQANRQPTYGLHRHPLVYTTDGAIEGDVWGYTVVRRTLQRTSHTDDFYQFIEIYKVSAFRDYSMLNP